VRDLSFTSASPASPVVTVVSRDEEGRPEHNLRGVTEGGDLSVQRSEPVQVRYAGRIFVCSDPASLTIGSSGRLSYRSAADVDTRHAAVPSH
jgi:phage-related baseplate assembly protein